LRVCATCGMGGEATYNSLLECVAQHNHMRCVGIDYMPVSWLCAPCIPVYMICHIIGKRMLSNRTENHLG